MAPVGVEVLPRMARVAVWALPRKGAAVAGALQRTVGEGAQPFSWISDPRSGRDF